MAREAVALAWTGASGAPYGLRLLECLLDAGATVELMISPAARVVLATEEDLHLPADTAAAAAVLRERLGVAGGTLRVRGHQEWTAPLASGSGAPRAMAVCPCSMGTLSAIATGASNNLIERAADVMLKERLPLVLVPRDTPLSLIHLENMLRVTRAGAVVLPASPGFYHRPRSVADLVDFVVDRVLAHLGFERRLLPPWGGDGH